MKKTNSTFQILKKQIHNQRGDALIIALIVATVSLMSSLAIMNYASQVQKVSKNPRLKSMMTALEAKVRSELLRPTSYNCTAGAGRSSCQLIENKITSLSRNLPEAQCPQGVTNCGIRVSIRNFEVKLSEAAETVSRATVLIRYEGTDLNMRDLDFVVDVPADILQNVTNGIYQCPQGAPKFNGFYPDGRLNCSALSPIAPGGSFVSAINPNTFETTALPLPEKVDCAPSGGFVGTVDWGRGGTEFSHACAPRSNPFVTFGFAPQTGSLPGSVRYTTR